MGLAGLKGAPAGLDSPFLPDVDAFPDLFDDLSQPSMSRNDITSTILWTWSCRQNHVRVAQHQPGKVYRPSGRTASWLQGEHARPLPCRYLTDAPIGVKKPLSQTNVRRLEL